MHHRGEKTDLGTSRSLTRLPFDPRNTVGRGRTEPRVTAFRSLLFVMCYLLFWFLLVVLVLLLFLFVVISATSYVLFVICFLVSVIWYVASVICYVVCGI